MTSVVYFAESGGLIKIGFSADIQKRLSTLRTASATPIALVGTLPGGRGLEKSIHSRLADYRRSGEWFVDCQEVRSILVEMRAEAEAGEANRLKTSPERVKKLLDDARGQPGNPDFSGLSDRFARLIDHPLMPRLIDARQKEKQDGLSRGTLMDEVLAGSIRRKYLAAFSALQENHALFGAVVAHIDEDDGADIEDFVACSVVGERLVSQCEASFVDFQRGDA